MTVDIGEIVKNYQDLLIVQYLDKPKARATIELFTKKLLADGIFWEVMDAFDLKKATGIQLDMIGKYVGVDRYFKGVIMPEDAFVFNDYSLQDPEGLGFGDYDGTAEGGDFILYSQFASKSQQLSDEDYRLLIKMKIARNNTNHSLYEIATDLYKFFGQQIRFTDNFNMSINYFIGDTIEEITEIAKDKDCLPRPVGVALNLIIDDESYFIMGDYSETSSGFGFGDYQDQLVEGGNLLSY